MYILTGSQNLQLMEAVDQSLAGRVGLLHLLPFSRQEMKDGVIRVCTIKVFRQPIIIRTTSIRMSSVM